MNRPNRYVWFVIVALGALLAYGCGDRSTDPSDLLALNTRLGEIEKDLAEANAKLAILVDRKPILPWREGKAEATAPDVLGAISHSLKAAASLVGNERVVGFFRDRTGAIFDKRITLPPLTKVAIKQKFQADIAEDIDKLLQ